MHHALLVHDLLLQDQSSLSKLKVLLKSLVFLFVGVALVTVFSNPMVDSLTSLTNSDNKKYFVNTKYGQYIPIPGTFFFCQFTHNNQCTFLVFYLSFIITPLCSNASELVSSLIFAAKKQKNTSSLTFSQVCCHVPWVVLLSNTCLLAHSYMVLQP